MYVTFTGFAANFMYGFKCREMEIKQWVYTSSLVGRSMKGVIVGKYNKDKWKGDRDFFHCPF